MGLFLFKFLQLPAFGHDSFAWFCSRVFLFNGVGLTKEYLLGNHYLDHCLMLLKPPLC